MDKSPQVLSPLLPNKDSAGGSSGPIEKISIGRRDFMPVSNDVAIDEQLGSYQLCYRKLAVYTSTRHKLYLLAGSQDFSNTEFQVLVINGFRNKDAPQDFSISQHQLHIPIGTRERKTELVEGLQKFFNDGNNYLTRLNIFLLQSFWPGRIYSVHPGISCNIHHRGSSDRYMNLI